MCAPFSTKRRRAPSPPSPGKRAPCTFTTSLRCGLHVAIHDSGESPSVFPASLLPPAFAERYLSRMLLCGAPTDAHQQPRSIFRVFSEVTTFCIPPCLAGAAVSPAMRDLEACSIRENSWGFPAGGRPGRGAYDGAVGAPEGSGRDWRVLLPRSRRPGRGIRHLRAAMQVWTQHLWHRVLRAGAVSQGRDGGRQGVSWRVAHTPSRGACGTFVVAAACPQEIFAGLGALQLAGRPQSVRPASADPQCQHRKIRDQSGPSRSRRCARDCQACRPTTGAAGCAPGRCQETYRPSNATRR